MNIAAVFTGVCVAMYVCVCVWPGPNGETMAHQLLFAEAVEQWASSDRDITLTHITRAQTPPHTLCQPWADKWKKRGGGADIYWLMMSPGGNVLAGYHAGLGTGRSFLHLFLRSAPCKIPMLAEYFIKFTVEQ